MKIAILGSGHIGGGLGRAWARKGHSILFGARDPKGAEVVAVCAATGARALPTAQAVTDAEVVVLAIPHGALDSVLAEVGPLEGKIVIDCTNAIGAGLQLKVGLTTSAAEETAARLPRARVFKSFNAQGAENLANPVYGEVRASNFFCGDDPAARAIVRSLVEDVGFDPIDAGPLRAARWLEPLTPLWISLSQSLGTRDLAFKVLRR